jgi:hypothetical protein
MKDTCVNKCKKYHIQVIVEKKIIQLLIYYNTDWRCHAFKKNSTNPSRFP